MQEGMVAGWVNVCRDRHEVRDIYGLGRNGDGSEGWPYWFQNSPGK